MDYVSWVTKSRVFILFILIAVAWRLNTTLHVKNIESLGQRLFANKRAFISSEFNTTNRMFLREMDHDPRIVHYIVVGDGCWRRILETKYAVDN